MGTKGFHNFRREIQNQTVVFAEIDVTIRSNCCWIANPFGKDNNSTSVLDTLMKTSNKIASFIYR